jgi:F420-non-reducing hydrogenase small subunit
VYKVLDKIRPISDVIKVDYELPGCAAEPSEIEATLVGLLKGNLPQLSSKSVCEECERERLEKPPKSFKRIFQEPEPKRCLLEQGYPCMGPSTRAGCKAKCPAVGIPCEGCRGPSVVGWDQGVAMLDALASISLDMVKNYDLKMYTGIFHRFTYAKSILAKLSRKG